MYFLIIRSDLGIASRSLKLQVGVGNLVFGDKAGELGRGGGRAVKLVVIPIGYVCQRMSEKCELFHF